MSAQAAQPAFDAKRMDLAMAAMMIAVIAMTVLPLPTFLIDLLLTTSLCLSVIILLTSIYVERPLEFSAFPSLLLFITLIRLALNVATSRVILTHGDKGAGAAGGVIQAFGELAIGGNYVVGAVVFLILVIVNYIVITKGAERVSEVSARFILDAMPGKQMAIDAELGAGLINETEARARRKEVENEADFHGAMDGASKFVRGDAVAGLLIVGVNIVGGFIVGVAQQDLSAADAAKTYTVLSVGDGLVTQIPALLISLAAGIITTRASTEGSLGGALSSQLLSRSKPLWISAVLLGALALVPGMPHVSFLALASLSALAARHADKRSSAGAPDASRMLEGDKTARATTTAAAKSAEDNAAQRKEIEAILPIDLLSLEIGLDLLPLVDVSRGGELLGRIGALRKQLAMDLGIIVPPVHVRDDLKLRGGVYRILVSGIEVATGDVRVGRFLAIDPTGMGTVGIEGENVKEPTFGLPAKWVSSSERRRAEMAGCTVVEPSAVIATHLTEVVRSHAHEILGRREAQDVIEIFGKQNGKLVEELVPHLLPQGEVIKVLKNLLKEGISIRDLRTILETLADHAAQVKDPFELTELVRQRLARQITAQLKGDAPELRAAILDPRAEEVFRIANRGGAQDPRQVSRIAAAVEASARDAAAQDEPMVLVVAPDVRRAVAAVAQRHAPGLTVLSYREIDPRVPLVTRTVVGAEEALAA
ncbi:MAG: flagellar biosynthesis protein FlhA [Deltaproteobacteria bacterium]|nr:flagellar biosynthesis protein FlhA [Deltaproteobacteria bacterium]